MKSRGWKYGVATSALVIVVSATAANAASGDAIEARLRVLEAEIAKLRREARQALGLPTARDRHAIVIGTIARLFPNKGYEQLIDIMQRAVAMQPDLHFLWVGDGSHRGAYEADLSRRGLRERVTITGLLPPTRMPQVLAAMDILAHASQWEGLPRAVVQALLMERPAVAFAIDGAPEVVQSGQTGFTVPLGDHEGFARALVALAPDEERRQAMGREGRRPGQRSREGIFLDGGAPDAGAERIGDRHARTHRRAQPRCLAPPARSPGESRAPRRRACPRRT